MCWFEPYEESKKLVKFHCQAMVDELKRLDRIGDPLGLGIDDVHKLLDHLFWGKCDEMDK